VNRYLHGCTVLVVACSLLAVQQGAHAQTWLSDTFTDDTVGHASNGPEIGSVYHACTAGASCDKYSVVSIGGNNMLYVNGEAGGLGLQWFLAGGGEGMGTVGYRFTPMPGGTVVGGNAFNLQLTAPGVTEVLMIGEDIGSSLSLSYVSYASGLGSTTELLPVKLQRGQEIFVQWDFDTVSDTLNLSLDGQLLRQTSFAGGLDAIISTSVVSNYATTASWLIDDVLATAVPEPASAALLLTGLVTIAARRRFRAGSETV